MTAATAGVAAATTAVSAATVAAATSLSQRRHGAKRQRARKSDGRYE